MKPTQSIYKIRNVKDGNFYIGSTNDSKRRFREHKRDFRKNIHGNIYLQNIYNKYGKDIFVYEIFKKLPDDILDADMRVIEQHYIDTLKPEYNISPNAFYPVISKEKRLQAGEKFAKEYILMDPQGNLLKIKNLHKFARENNLLIGSLSSVSRGRTRQHRGWKVRSASEKDWMHKEKREYILINPNGIVFESLNVKDFARKNNLNYEKLIDAIHGNVFDCDGWRGFKVGFEHQILVKKPSKREWIIINPIGREITVENLKKFCMENNLDAKELSKVARGKRKDFHGWKSKIIGEEHPEFKCRVGKQYVVTSPAGVETDIRDLSKFCRENGLESKNMNAVSKGICSQHKGWKCRDIFDESPRYINRLTKNWIVVSPSGEEKKIDNLAKFSRENNLNKSCMQSVAYGKMSNHKGWICRFAENIKS